MSRDDFPYQIFASVLSVCFVAQSFRSYIYISHLEFVLIQSERSQIWAFYLHGDSFSLSHLLKRLPLYISGSLFKESVGHRRMGVSFANFLFHWSMCLLLCQYYIVLAVNGCVICPEIMYCGFFMFVLFLHIALLICGLLCFRVNFRIVFLVLWRK